MKKIILSLSILVGFTASEMKAQTNPAITSWLINTTGITGRHYVNGNSTPISDTAHANVQRVRYSNNYAYINCSGVPSYIVGPYNDGNPSLATNNNLLIKLPLNPVQNSGAQTETSLGSIGVFINGVQMYDYKDGQSYKLSSQQDSYMGDGTWNRNAILAENAGFDCSKGHPSPIFSGGPGQGTLIGGTYHHHQNPTAYNMATVELSDICDLYLADGLFTLDASVHSPLIGFAFDGFPVYGAYGYANADGTGGLKLIMSSYQKRNITTRTTHSNGSTVTAGPAVSSAYPLGWYREDYEYIANSGELDEHNGRFCVTPEYPNGTYAYFATVDEDFNSAYPYMVGPTYYGITTNGGTVTNVTEATTDYVAPNGISENTESPMSISIFPNPASDLVAVQVTGLLRSNMTVKMYDLKGSLVAETSLNQGSTIWHLDTRTIYNGEYLVVATDGKNTYTQKLMIQH
ncbi:MAG: YHYH protein [Salibacteraceae bacterium]|jgi:hypothetical protein|nr:YHYH protein [Salibacteraceae bacterium]MDP4685967.1 YHYH protein [Salibacteraceae bacterium]MDP4764442.1 YHYH protein [Salibacteraceae bacterium]MDP4845002.1 YHYH protein [Salibacteraceae bacterium]MDP4933987.1 YHYH protein [Salibacteraceae bacterium]